jgi:NAD(P)-dependent dehydrogenase (short-subunit alcohol dehydrogenase family)
MTDLRFDGRTAIVTGGGRGLGRAYALLLASRGSKVVVNDIGGDMRGEGPDAGPAQEVVDEIKAAGGQAVACTDSVATVEGGKAIIDCALDTFGSVDIVVPNAGNVRYGLLDEIPQEEFEAVLDVHLHGAWNIVRPAFELMTKAGYGRIVLTSSISGLYGNERCVNYAMSKTSMVGLNNVAAIEGAGRGVKSNIIIPAAVTRMSEGIDITQFPPMDPDLVAAVVGWLAHESCSVTGEMLISAAGRVARAFFTETEGVFRPSWTPEDVAANIDAIRDPARQWTFQPVPSGMGEHLGKSFEMARKGWN